MASIPASFRLCFHGSASGFHGSLQLLCNLVILGGHGSQLTWRVDQSDSGILNCLHCMQDRKAAVGISYAKANALRLSGNRMSSTCICL